MRLFVCLLLSLGLFLSCRDKETKAVNDNVPSEQLIREIYGAYVQGDFQNYVNHVHSFKDKPEKYKTQIVNMMKQRAATRHAAGIQIDSFVVSKIAPLEPKKTSRVFLMIYYSDQKNEEVVLPMLFDQNTWWVK